MQSKKECKYPAIEFTLLTMQSCLCKVAQQTCFKLLYLSCHLRVRRCIPTSKTLNLLQSQRLRNAYVKTRISACKTVEGGQTYSAFPPPVQPESVNSARQPWQFNPGTKAAQARDKSGLPACHITLMPNCIG